VKTSPGPVWFTGWTAITAAPLGKSIRELSCGVPVSPCHGFKFRVSKRPAVGLWPIGKNLLPMKTTTRAARSAGLDTLRACAITLVFMYHYMVFVSGTPTFGWLSVVGWAGVDLFFVLSGYLIANQLFSGLARGHALSVNRFYARRAFRTLPVFWLVLAAYFLLPDLLGGRAPPPLWRFLTFTQNIGLQPGTAFSHAWSLCVEEQFYLVLPLALAAAAWLARGRVSVDRRHGWLLLGALLVLGMTSRGLLWLQIHKSPGGDPSQVMALIYYSTLCRFDEFIPGIAVAMLKNFYPALWARAISHGRGQLAAGLTGAVAILALSYFEGSFDKYGFFMTTFGYSLLAASFGLLVAAALSPATALYRGRIPGAAPLALWSYSIYLSHKPLAYVLKQALAPWAIPDPALTAVIAVSSVALGALMYLLVEAPFMALRDRVVPSNFDDEARPVSKANGAVVSP
jgi:peptidoglycan/LPS O-acetylase OafA/YrhL